jgi:hypothetical protein
METLLRREGEVENWNDDRLDELSRRMDAGFTRVDLGMNRRFDEVDCKIDGEFDKVSREFGRLNDRLDKLFWGIGFVGLTIGLNILADKV